MGFFDDFTKVADKAMHSAGTVVKSAVSKSSDFAEISKYKMKISAEDKAIEDLYFRIGEKIYEDCVSNGVVPELVQEECATIYEHKARISQLKGKIELIRGDNDNLKEDDVKNDDFYDDEEVVIEEISTLDDNRTSSESNYGVLHDVIGGEKKKDK